MERESNPMQPMCRAGCGFYGNPAQEGFCSVCYKDVLRKKQQPPVSSTPSSNNAPQTPAPSQSVTASSVSIRPVATPSSFASTIGSSSTTTTSASSASPSAASPSASSCAASANNPAVSASYSAQSTVHSALFCSDKDEENQGDELQNLSFHSTNYGHGKCNSCEVDPVEESSDAYGDLLVQSWIVEKEEDDEEDEDVDLFSITDCPNSKAECDSDSNDEYLLYEFLGESKSTCVDPTTSRSLESVKSVAGKKDKSNNLQSSSNGGGGVMRKRKICTDDSGSLGGHSNNSSIADNDDKDGDKEDAKKKKNRCATCRKKVGLTGFECRCGGLFCAIHRYSDKHECSFDYRELGAAEIRRNNPVVVGEKIQKI